jgi:hypothetical protein
MRYRGIDMEDTATIDVIAMNLTMAAIEPWLRTVDASRRGEDLGREIGAMYREIHAAVDEMASTGSDDEDDDDYELGDEDDDEDERGDEEEEDD